MLKITPMTPSHLEQVVALCVEPDQLPFVGTVEEVLLNADDNVHPHLVIVDERVVGIFLIDTLYSAQYRFAHTGSLGFRAFLIDAGEQGKGYGRDTIKNLEDYLRCHYPDHGAIYLTVNCKNLAAKQCYLKYGFKDQGELYHGGAAGPQHIMLMDYTS